MERREEKRYTTGEFANYFGIKKDTLFYYDRIGLFRPAGVEDNGYRYYTSSQVDMFWTLLSLREIGLSVKTLQEYFREPSPERLKELAAEQIQKIDAEMKKLRKIKGLLTDISQGIKEAVNAVPGQVKMEMLPDRRFLYSRENKGKADTSNEEWKEIYDDFARENRIAGAACVGSVISQADLARGQFGYVNRLFTESPGRGGTVRRGGIYAVYYYKGSYDGLPEIYPYILSEIERQGFAAAGDAYEEYLIAEIAAGCEEDYMTKIVIRVESAEKC